MVASASLLSSTQLADSCSEIIGIFDGNFASSIGSNVGYSWLGLGCSSCASCSSTIAAISASSVALSPWVTVRLDWTV